MKLFVISLLLLFVCIFSGCIGEDIGSCPPEQTNNLILKFIHMDNQGNDLFVDYIHRVDVFVFDSQERLVFKQRVDKSALSIFAGTQMNLAPGTYYLVCWGNASERTLFSGVDAGDLFNDAFLCHTTDNTVATNGDPLYYGPSTKDTPALSFSVTVPEQGTVSSVIPFCSAHIKIEVYVKGFEEVSPQQTFSALMVELTPVPAECNFDLQNSESYISYSDIITYGTIEGQQIATIDFYPPLFDENTSKQILIKRQPDGSTVTSISLKDFIRENQINLTSNTQIVIPILVEYKQASVNITLPGWGQKPLVPEL